MFLFFLIILLAVTFPPRSPFFADSATVEIFPKNSTTKIVLFNKFQYGDVINKLIGELDASTLVNFAQAVSKYRYKNDLLQELAQFIVDFSNSYHKGKVDDVWPVLDLRHGCQNIEGNLLSRFYKFSRYFKLLKITEESCFYRIDWSKIHSRTPISIYLESRIKWMNIDGPLDPWIKKIVSTLSGAISELLKKNRNIVSMTLSDYPFGPERIHEIAIALQDHCPLKLLKLMNVNPSNDPETQNVMHRFIGIIHASCPKMKMLGFGGSEITNELVEYSFETLKTSNIEHFLAQGSVTDTGVQAIAETLKQWESLRVLDLSYNEIGVVGLKALNDVLNQSKIIEVEIINNPPLDFDYEDEDMEVDGIHQMDLDNNDLSPSEEEIEHLATQRNRRLELQRLDDVLEEQRSKFPNYECPDFSLFD